MSHEEFESVNVADRNPWIDAAVAIETIDYSVSVLESKFSRAIGKYKNLSEYAGNSLFIKNLYSLTYLGEDAFESLVGTRIDGDDFTENNSKAAKQGYTIALRACLELSKKRNRSIAGSSLVNLSGLIEMRMQSLLNNGDREDKSSFQLLSEGINSFVYNFQPEPPTNPSIIKMDINGESFTNRWAYKLGYLQPINAAFELLIDPDTYYDLIKLPKTWKKPVPTDFLNNILDIYTLPVAEES